MNNQKSYKPNSELRIVRSVYAEDLAELCKADELALNSTLAAASAKPSEIRVALVPDVNTLQWHHAREEFVANELLGKWPQVKGAMVKCGEGQRVWCVWTRTFGSGQDGNTLNILRLVIEGEVEGRENPSQATADARLDEPDYRQVLAAARVIRSACLEAAKWTMNDVQLWNPTRLTVMAAKQIEPSAKVIERAEESIASLRWHGPKSDLETEVKWLGNEKYGWC